MMKKIILLIAFFSATHSLKAQVFNADWSRHLPQTSSAPAQDLGHSTYVDALGDVYTTGNFKGTIDADPSIGGTAILSSSGDFDIYVSKLDINGNFLWAKSFGGLLADKGLSITGNVNSGGGAIYITGNFHGTAVFGSTTLTSLGANDAFVTKLDPTTGNVLWAVQFGGVLDEKGNGVALDPAGFVYITGQFQGTVDFDPSTATANLTSAGLEDIFVCKLSAGGSYVWAKRIGGIGSDSGNGLVLQSANIVYVTGYFSNAVDFDPGIGTYWLTSTGMKDAFVTTLIAINGNFGTWARKMGGPTDDIGNSIALDISGNTYTTGSFKGTCTPFVIGGGSMGSLGLEDIFVCKLNSLGTYLAKKQIGGSLADIGNGIAIGTDVLSSGISIEKVYLAGTHQGISSHLPLVAPIASNGLEDIYVAKLNSTTLDVETDRGIGGTGLDGASSIATFGSRAYITGGFSNTTVFIDPTLYTYSSAGDIDIYVMKFYDTLCTGGGMIVTASNPGGCGTSSCSVPLSGSPSGGIYTYPGGASILNPYIGSIPACGIPYKYTYTDASGCIYTALDTVTGPKMPTPITATTTAGGPANVILSWPTSPICASWYEFEVSPMGTLPSPPNPCVSLSTSVACFKTNTAPLITKNIIASSTPAPCNFSIGACYDIRIRIHCLGTVVGPWSAPVTICPILKPAHTETTFNTSNEISVYPNPIQGELNIELNATEKQTGLIRILDLSGRLVKQVDFNIEAGHTNSSVNLSELVNGLYIVQVYTNNKLSYASKISKE